MLTQLIKEKISELSDKFLEKNIGVMFSYKEVNEIKTEHLSITFLVKKKIPINLIPENEILPTTITIGDEVFLTDVIEINHIISLACNQEVLDNCYGWKTVSPPNRNTIRPLQGGVSISSYSHSGIYGPGSLGFLAVDITTNGLVGVTNAHVVAALLDFHYTGYRNMNNSNIILSELNDGVVQTGEFLGTSIDITTNRIGDVIRYAPVKTFPQINYVDGALTSIFESEVATGLDITTPKSWMQYEMTGITEPMEFATTAEIDALLINPPSEVKSAGRTTSIKQGVCGLKIVGLGVAVTVGLYGLQNIQTTVRFGDVIAFQRINSDCPSPIEGGDSGSALIAVINGTPKIIGLNFAGSKSNNQTITGYACRIDRVVEELSIGAWDGVNHNFIDTSYDIFTVPGGSFDRTLICSGETYWQMGATLINLPCN
jgi:hypothetical protein